LAPGLPVATDVDVDRGWLAAVVESSVYFCCAEALQNAAKHSEARHISVWVRNEDDQIRLTIRDDGRGFSIARLERQNGLRNIADRLEALGGRVRIESRPGNGTLIEGCIPLTSVPASTSRAIAPR